MRKILLVVLTMSLMLSFGVLATFAQDDTEDDDTTTQVWPGGMRGMHGGFGHLANDAAQFALIAETLGMDEADLITALQDGQTLTEIAEAQGVELTAITEAFAAERQVAYEEQLTAAVEAGDITQEEADALLVLFNARQEDGNFAFGNMLDGRNLGQHGQVIGGKNGFGFIGGSQNMLTVTAEALGMEEADLITALQDGQTLAEIAEAQGVELETITDAITATYAEQLAAAVEAGSLTEDQVAAMQALHETNMAAFLSGDNADMFGGMFGFGGRGSGMMWNSDGQTWHGGRFGGHGSGMMWNQN